MLPTFNLKVYLRTSHNPPMQSREHAVHGSGGGVDQQKGSAMKKELQRQLRERYPLLLQYPEHSPICERGIETLDGWYALIDASLGQIQRHASACSAHDRLVIRQIKEKLGSLRIYLSDYDEVIEQIRDDAARRSLTTCEKCGGPGDLVKNCGWLGVRCSACRDLG